MVRLDHVRLAVRDWQASRDWYLGNFGFRIEFEIPDGGYEKTGVAALQDDAGLTVFVEQVGRPQGGGGCILYFQVSSVDEVYHSLSARGVGFLATPQKFFWGYGAELADPDGHVLRIWDKASMHAD